MEALNRRPLRRRRRRQSGQSLVEFALMTPLILLVSLGIFDFGRVLFAYASGSASLRNALRYGTILGYQAATAPNFTQCATMIDVAEQVVFAAGTPSVRVDFRRPDNNNIVSNCTTNGGISSGAIITGDLLVIRTTATVETVSPYFPSTLTIDFVGQRTIVRDIQIGEMAACGNGVCDLNETYGGILACPTDCPVDCLNGRTGTTAGTCDPDWEDADNCTSDCNHNDGVCDSSENPLTAPSDCGPGASCDDDGDCEVGESSACATNDCDAGGGPNTCGNLICEGGGENVNTCPADCSEEATCDSDNACEPGENSETCPGDCDTPGSFCGNSTCDAGENATNCPGDGCAGGGGGTCGDNTCETTEMPGQPDDCPVDCTDPGCVGGRDDGTCQAVETHALCPDDCLLPTCGNNTCDFPELTNTCPHDCVGDCGDGSCDPEIGELSTCPSDCPCDDDGICEDGTLGQPNTGENATTCPSDCQSCGDEICDGSETTTNCPGDCACNNGTCDPGELPGEPDACLADCPHCGVITPPGASIICDPEESTTSCASDCYCNNGTCDNGENFITCAQDCCPSGNCASTGLGCDGDGVCEPTRGEDSITCPAENCSTTLKAVRKLTRLGKCTSGGCVCNQSQANKRFMGLKWRKLSYIDGYRLYARVEGTDYWTLVGEFGASVNKCGWSVAGSDPGCFNYDPPGPAKGRDIWDAANSASPIKKIYYMIAAYKGTAQGPFSNLYSYTCKP